MDVRFQIENALQIIGDSFANALQTYEFLGEGAWHRAYLLNFDGDRKFVIRFPKPVAYGKTVVFNEQEFRSEYAAAGYYYQQVGKVASGICPDEFHYHVTPELTFTLETYMGQRLDLASTSPQTAYEYGQQLGDFFRKVADLPNELSGYGFMAWKDTGLAGRLSGDGQQNVYSEKNDYAEEMNALLRAEDLSFDRETVLQKFQSCIERRDLHLEPIVLVNQDMSPENVIIREGKIALIDPLPLLYNATIYAANNICNYKYVFATHHNAPRYAHHQFDCYEDQLFAIADGFEEAYVQGKAEVLQRVRRETYLLLVSTAHRHLKALTGEFTTEQQIRMGDRDVIRARLQEYLRELEAFTIE